MYILMRDLRKYALMVFVTFVSIIPINVYHFIKINSLKNALSVIIIIFLLVEYKSWFNKKNALINGLVILFTISAFHSTYRFKEYIQFIPSAFIANLLSVPLLFFVGEYVSSKRYVGEFIRIQVAIISFFCVVNDVLMILLPGSYGGANMCLFGNKFSVSYMHILLFALVLYGYKNSLFKYNNKNAVVILFIFTTAISYYTECTTAFVECMLFVILYFVFPSIKDFFLNSWIATVVLIAVSDSVLLISEGVYNSKIFKFIVEGLLHESADLTGRVTIYSNAFASILVSPVWGVGKENNYTIASTISNASNLQNGVLDLVLSYGIVGLVIWISVFITGNILAKKNKNDTMWIFVIIMIIVSIVEVAFRNNFWLYLTYSSVLYIEQVKEND